jgi:hypothetical protein
MTGVRNDFVQWRRSGARRGDRPGDGLIEHMRQHDVIKTADWVIDLGPGGGVNGGKIVVEGTPETVAAEPKSFTGQYLKPILQRASVKPEVVQTAPKKRPKPSRRRSPGLDSGADEGAVEEDEDELNLAAAK